MKRYNYQMLITLIGIIILYFFLSVVVNNPFILPQVNVIIDYFTFIETEMIVNNAMITIWRTIMSYLISLVVALSLAVIANYKRADLYINPIISILKTIPTISIMIIAFIWLGRNESVFLIGFLVIFPILYEMFYHNIKYVDKDLLEVSHVYQFSFFMRVKYVYFYRLLDHFFVSLKQTFGLGFKIMVMSEVIGQTTRGIGIQLYNEKVNLSFNSLAGVYAWTIILVIIVLLIDFLIDKCSKKILKWR